MGDLIERGRQVTVLVQVPDDGFRDFANHLGADRDAQLPAQVVGKALRGREKFLKRGLFRFFALAACRALGARIEVLIEERAEIEFVERIRGGSFGNFLDFLLQKRFVGIAVLGGSFFCGFLENGIGHDLLIDHLPQLETVQRQHADHLHEARRQNLLLRHAQA